MTSAYLVTSEFGDDCDNYSVIGLFNNFEAAEKAALGSIEDYPQYSVSRVIDDKTGHPNFITERRVVLNWTLEREVKEDGVLVITEMEIQS